MPSSPGTPSPHSTLEVDIEAQRENERQARLDHSSSKHPPKMLATPDKDANAPEVAGDGSLPIPWSPGEFAPQVIDSDTLPEPIPMAETKALPPHRTCGMRRRNFWVLVAVVVTAIVAIAIGAGVGASRSHPGSSTGDKSLLSKSKLAAVNFTADGVDFNCVYYQLSSGEIHQSVWNSTARTWTGFPVVTDAKNILDNTPISADMYWKSANERRHHVFYYDADQKIRGKAADTPYTDTWDDNNGFDQKDYGGNGLSLASYAKECDTCFNANAVVYSDGNLQYATPKTDSGRPAWSQNPLPATIPQPADGTQLEIKPLYNGTAGNGKYIVLFMTSKRGKLAKLLYDGTSWDGENLDVSLTSNAAIAAFTTGTFVNGSDADSNYTIQVLNTHSAESGGGVTLSSYSSASSSWNSSALGSGFEKVLNGSGLAANQAGRVYGTVLSDSGSPQLMEWAWHIGNGTYSMIGAVDTNTTA